MWTRLRFVMGMLGALFGRRQLDERLRDELEFHRDCVADQYRRVGMAPDEALRHARLAVGGFEQARETVRDARGCGLVEDFGRDCRHGWRSWRRSPAFTVVAIVTLALGIGANTAIFTVVNAVLLRPLPYGDADRLVTIWEKNLGGAGAMIRSLQPDRQELVATSVPILQEWQSHTELFQSVGAYSAFPARLALTGGDEPEEVLAGRVTANFFSTLGVPPMLGRGFHWGEDRLGHNHVIVLSHELWQRRFGADRTISGKPAVVNGAVFTVVGVMPSTFQPMAGEQAWVPSPIDAQAGDGFRGSRNMEVIARLKPGVAVDHVQSVLRTGAEVRARVFPKWSGTWTTVVVPLREHRVGDMRGRLLLLFAATVIVVLMACANLANMLLARGMVRRREVVLRAALGASRWRLIRQAVAETTLLALAGGAAGLGLGQWMVGLLGRTRGADVGELGNLHTDWRVLGFALAASILVGLVTALVPAWQATRADVNTGLREAVGDQSGRATSRRLGGLLAVSELGCALVLLAGAGLMVNTLTRLAAVDVGFSTHNLLTARLTLPPYKYSIGGTRWDDVRAQAFLAAVLTQIRAIAGVRDVGAVYPLPFSRSQEGTGISAEGSHDDSNVATHYRISTPEYFRAMQIPLVRGRFFTDLDSADAPSVVIVNDTLAHTLWPGQNPIGKRVRLHGRLSEVVGVVGDARHLRPDLPSGAESYVPRAQTVGYSTMFLAVRTTGDPTDAEDAMRAAIWAVDKHQPVQDVQTMDDRLSGFTALRRFYTLMLGLFAGIAVLLAAVGVYGVISYSVSQRRQEIGIRLALGARPRDVVAMVVRQGMWLAGVGLLVGLGGALAATRALSGMLYGIGATDPLTFAAVSVMLTVVTLLACFLPARRATRVDPVLALRAE